jgi:hypothetical protein
MTINENGLAYFLNSDSVNRPLFFEVFSFKICSDPFALVGSDGGEKFDFFKSARLGG